MVGVDSVGCHWLVALFCEHPFPFVVPVCITWIRIAVPVIIGRIADVLLPLPCCCA